MLTLIADIRYAARKLLSAPGFTTIAVLTLTLAIGASTALFSIVNSVVLNALPYAHPERLVVLASTSPTGAHMPASPRDLIDYRDQSGMFSDVAGIDAGENATLTRPGSPAIRLGEARVGATLFRVLGVQPAFGRFFAAGEDSANAAKVVVLSNLAWHRYFGGDTSIVGQSVTLDGEQYRVVGIAKHGLDYPQSPDIWVPLVWRSFEVGDAARGYHATVGAARLRDGVTIEAAQGRLTQIAARLAEEFPSTNAKIGALVSPLQHQIVGDVSRALWPMLGAVLVVLLIACTNIANLLLVRATAREPEIAVRTALGAERTRIVRQLITESMLLWIAGALFGTLVATWLLSAVSALGPRDLPRLDEIAIDGRVLAFAFVITVITGLAFGLVPAIQAARTDVAQLIRASGRVRGRRGANRARSAFVLAEVALATVLLVGAALLIRSFERLVHVDPGFRSSHLVVADVALTGGRYRHDAGNIAYANDVLARLAAIPGVQHVAVAADRPLDPDGPFGASTSFTVDDAPKPKPGTEPDSRLLPVSPSYFTTVGMTLVRGRFFTDAENRLDAPPVVVIDDELARRYFPNENPIGKHLTYGLSHSTTGEPGDTIRMRGEIVGIVKHAVHEKLGEKAQPSTYFPYVTAPFGATFVVRTERDPATVEADIGTALRAQDPNVSIYELGTMDDAVSVSVAQPRFYTLLLGAFAGLALLLAALGVFGVMSFIVGQRTREFGIRIALGATVGDLVHSVVREGLGLALSGIAVGAVISAGLTRVIRDLLYGTGALDLTAFVAASAVLAAAAALAAWLPARRAARVDPMQAMRAE
ncbi:MAG TPA: ABC transporter permease [Gemmatimonadaceae bacterium]|nr:ABC transporter permease [Gemmatimonadaceae bacterium]